MKPTETDFGRIGDATITLFTLSNSNGMQVKIMNYGATITSVQVPDRDGNLTEVACGFDSLEGYFSENYKANSPYFGATIGRYCSHIKDAKFSLNGKDYQLAGNGGGNNLHGGTVGFDKKIWSAKVVEDSPDSSLEMNLLSEDMEEGFPGNVAVKVLFSLNESNEFSIRYQAKTDAPTPLAVTNHTYFNLSGFKNNILGHSAQISASRRLAMDATGAVTGYVIDLEKQPDNLSQAKIIAEVHQEMNDGFEHYYVFDKPVFKFEKVAEITCAETGISLDITTDEPGMLFYTGKYTCDSLRRESGHAFGKFRGFCCETHRFPNGPNLPGLAGTILNPGEEFNSMTKYSFH